jgi:hypothetical protein
MLPIADVARSLVLVAALLTSAVTILPAQATGAITGLVMRGGQDRSRRATSPASRFIRAISRHQRDIRVREATAAVSSFG